MKALILTLLLAAFVGPVQAQQLNMPKVIKLHNKATGETIGTVTITGTTAYYRNKDGQHYATGVRNPDGSSTFFDPNGNIIGPIKTPD